MAAELECYGKFSEVGAKQDVAALDRIVGGDDASRLHTIHLARLALTEGKAWAVVHSVRHVLMRYGRCRGEHVHKVARILGVPVMPKGRANRVPKIAETEPIGSTQSIVRRANGFYGASDPRRPGALTKGY